MPTTSTRTHPGSRFFTAGCCVAILTGIVKAGTHFIEQPAPTTPDEAELLRLMSGFVLPEIGRTTEQILLGFSWWFCLAMVAPALISMAVRRGRAGDGALLRTLAVGHALMMGVGLVISLRYFFAIPTGFIGTAFACYTVAGCRALSAAPAA